MSRIIAASLFGLMLVAPVRLMASTDSVILIIADGFGSSIQDVVRLVKGPLAVDAMNEMALVTTFSADKLVTDSAAGATAMATGKKGANAALSMSPAGQPITTVAERAKAAGKQVGMITTSYLWDATLGAFYAHVADRHDTDVVTRQALESRFDLFLGGGELGLLPKSAAGRFGPGERKDGRNLLKAFKSSGYHVVHDLKKPLRLPALGLFAGDEMFRQKPPAVYRPSPTLAEMVQSGLEALALHEAGFFLVVEEEGTDEMLHAGSLEMAVRAAAGWDEAVKAALAFVRKHPDTALIVTSDHETAGVTILAEPHCKSGMQMIQDKAGESFCVSFTTRGHSAASVPLFAHGIQVGDAVIDNTHIHALIGAALGLKVADEE